MNWSQKSAPQLITTPGQLARTYDGGQFTLTATETTITTHIQPIAISSLAVNNHWGQYRVHVTPTAGGAGNVDLSPAFQIGPNYTWPAIEVISISLDPGTEYRVEVEFDDNVV